MRALLSASVIALAGLSAHVLAAAPTPLELATLVVPRPTPPATRTPTADIRRLLRPEASLLEARSRLDQDLERRGKLLTADRALEAALERDRATQASHVDAVRGRLATHRAAIQKRIRALVALAETPCATRVLGRAEWATPMFACLAAGRLALADYARLFAYQQQVTLWRLAEADLLRRTQNVAYVRERIGYLEQELAWDAEERAALEAAVIKEPEFYAAYAHEMDVLDLETAQKVESLLVAAPKDRARLYLEETKGGLSSPIRNADLVGGFGTRQFLGVRSTWHGVHLVPMRPPKAGERVDVRAIYWGYVAWTGWLEGLGKVVIVDHTMGYASLYGHLADIDVKVGDKVATGTPLGAMGATESFFGPRLYLELRKDGVSLDPMPWFRK